MAQLTKMSAINFLNCHLREATRHKRVTLPQLP